MELSLWDSDKGENKLDNLDQNLGPRCSIPETHSFARQHRRPPLSRQRANSPQGDVPVLVLTERAGQRRRVTWGFLSFLGVVSYRIRILMYSDVSSMYLDRILTFPVHVHQDTSRYIRIQLYL